MSWLVIFLIVGVVVTVAVWMVFVYIEVQGTKTEIPDRAFGTMLEVQGTDERGPMKILLAIDGSTPSVAAVQEVAYCPLPPDSTIEVLYVIHSRLPVIPDFPPWAVTIAAAHGESIREQSRRAPELLEAAAKLLQRHQRQATVVTKTVEGAPKDEILREAAAWGADRIVLGSHGRGRAQRALLGTTAAAVAAEARCTVEIARRRQAAAGAVTDAKAA
jgi:nucleotide-binding universal stress UspA family protein